MSNENAIPPNSIVSGGTPVVPITLRKAQPALERLIAIAFQDTGQARRASDFLLSWHNAEENGGWNPADLWSVDDAIADDMLAVLHLIRQCHCYPDKLGFGQQMEALWRLWRTALSVDSSDNSGPAQE